MVWSIAALIALIGLDQGLKYWTVTNLALGESLPLIPGVMQLTRLHNYGAAWSSLSGKTIVLLVITSVLMIAVAVLLMKKIVRHRLGVTAGIFIIGGGLGAVVHRGHIRRRPGQHDRPGVARLCGGYAGHFSAVFLSGLQSGGLLRGGGRHSGLRVLPVVL